MAAPLAPPLPAVVKAPDAPADGNMNATRHLCAGAYLDPEFCLTALREVYYRTSRMIAPSHGFDTSTVLGHCLRAHRAMVIRDALLVAVLVMASWLSLAAAPAALLSLLAVHVAAVTARAVREAIRDIVDGGYFRDKVRAQAVAGRRSPRKRDGEEANMTLPLRVLVRSWLADILTQIVGRVLGIVLAYLVLLTAMVLLSVRVWHSRTLAGVRLGLSWPYVVACSVALVFLVPAITRVWNRIQVRAFVPGRIPERPRNTRRLYEIDRLIDGNTVVYSGHNPFIGAGMVLRNWDITLRLVRPVAKVPGFEVTQTEAQREFERPPFTAKEISDHVRRYVAELASDPVPERRLADLTVVDRVFVAGTEIGALNPCTHERDVAHIMRYPTAPERHFLQCQVISWHGELVMNVYVHFAVQAKALYVEMDVTGLSPCDSRYRIVDQVGGTSVRRVPRDAARALVEAPSLMAAAPVSLVLAVRDLIGITLARRSPGLRVRKGYDYGAAVSLREIGTSRTSRDPMQTQDIVKYWKVIERRVLAAILDFLEDHGVDVTEYRQTSLTILNTGAVAANGGTVNVSGDAIGNQQNNPPTNGSEW